MINNSYFKYGKYGPNNGIYKDLYIDHQDKSLPHIEFTDECIDILKLIITRTCYIPNVIIETTLFDKGYTELFEE